MNMIWSKGAYDYFRTSDGHLYRALRNLAREAAEKRHERAMYWISLVNRTLVYLAIGFSCADVVFVALLIWFGGEL